MRNIPSSGDDTIDSRDIIQRLKELDSDHDDLQTALDEAQEALELAQSEARGNTDEAQDEALEEAVDQALDNLKSAREAFDEWDDKEEYEALKELENECSGYCDWRYGETLIADHYFTQYAQELAEETGALDSNAKWPATCIDWDEAAKELQQDYTQVTFNGVDYWVRS